MFRGFNQGIRISPRDRYGDMVRFLSRWLPLAAVGILSRRSGLAYVAPRIHPHRVSTRGGPAVIFTSTSKCRMAPHSSALSASWSRSPRCCARPRVSAHTIELFAGQKCIIAGVQEPNAGSVIAISHAALERAR